MTEPLAFSFFSVTLTLFLLCDAFGNIPIFSSMLKHLPAKRQRFVIMREHLIAFFVILLFSFLGEYLLKLLKINIHIVDVSGGVILFLIALRMIFPDQHGRAPHAVDEEPFIVPLAIPLIAGPAVLATSMIYSRTIPAYYLIPPIFVALFLSMGILLSLPLLKKLLGTKFLQALERLMGMILILMAFEMLFDGIKGFFLI